MVQVFKPLTKSKLHAKVSVGRAGHTGAWGECEMRGGKRGFTLIELLVVIAIIAILAAILFPVFTVARNAGKKAACVSNLREIDYAYRMYLADSGDRYPSNHFGANLFLVEPYLRSRRFKLADTSGGLDTSVWLCKAAYGRFGMWYRVQKDYWGTKENTPWYQMGVNTDWCRVWNSYVVNADVTADRKGPGLASRIARSSRTVFFAEASYNEKRLGQSNLDLGTVPTATHPSADPKEIEGFFPTHAYADIQAWHTGGSNFLYCDGHIRYLKEVPPLENWVVPL